MTIEDLCGEEIECIVTKSGYGKDYYNLEKVINELENYLLDIRNSQYNSVIESIVCGNIYDYLQTLKEKYNVK